MAAAGGYLQITNMYRICTSTRYTFALLPFRDQLQPIPATNQTRQQQFSRKMMSRVTRTSRLLIQRVLTAGVGLTIDNELAMSAAIEVELPFDNL